MSTSSHFDASYIGTQHRLHRHLLRKNRTPALLFLVLFLIALLLFITTHPICKRSELCRLPRHLAFTAFNPALRQAVHSPTSLTLVVVCPQLCSVSSCVTRTNTLSSSLFITQTLVFVICSTPPPLPSPSSISTSSSLYVIKVIVPNENLKPSVSALFNLGAALSSSAWLLFTSHQITRLHKQLPIILDFESQNQFYTLVGTTHWSSDAIPRAPNALVVRKENWMSIHGANELMHDCSPEVILADVSRRLQATYDVIALPRDVIEMNTKEVFGGYNVASDALPKTRAIWASTVTSDKATKFRFRQGCLFVDSSTTAFTKRNKEVVRASLGQTLHDRFGLPWDIARYTSAGQRFNELLQRRIIDDVVIVRVIHGLGNRLRAMASAIALGNGTRRGVVVIWTRDAHCGIQANAVLNLSLSSADGSHHELNIDGITVPVFVVTDDRSMWDDDARVKVLSSDRELKGVKWTSTTEILQKLPFEHRITQYVQRYARKLKASVCVHVRHLSYSSDVRGVIGRDYYTDIEIGEAFRKLSSPRILAHAASAIATAHKRKLVFVAGDNEQWLHEMQRLMVVGAGNADGHDEDIRVWWHDATCEKGRGERDGKCMETGVRDLVSLSHCSVIVGSAYSSFTDVAARMGGVLPVIAGMEEDASGMMNREIEKAVSGISAEGGRRVWNIVGRYRNQRHTKRKRGRQN